MNWLPTSLPRLVEVIGPLLALLEVLSAETSRTKIVTKNRAINDEEWAVK